MKTTVFWSCTGVDGSALSYTTAELLSDAEKTLIVELPCLGIPRLGFVCGISDRSRNTEEAIASFAQRGVVPWEMAHAAGKNLYALPANVYAIPDYPIVSKIGFQTLMDFIAALAKLAQERECGRLILECQGQLNSPMSFFALQEAETIVIPLSKPSEAAYALASIRRLVHVYKFDEGKFILACAGNTRLVESAAFTKTEGEEALSALQVTAWDSRKIKKLLSKEAKTKQKPSTNPEGEAEKTKRRGFRLPGFADLSLSSAGESAAGELSVRL